MFKRILAAAFGIFLTGQIASATINAPTVLRDGPGGSGYPQPTTGGFVADGPGQSTPYLATLPTMFRGPGSGGGYINDDGPGLGGGYIADDGPGLGGGYVTDDGPGLGGGY